MCGTLKRVVWYFEEGSVVLIMMYVCLRNEFTFLRTHSISHLQINVFLTVAPDLYAVFIDIGHYIFPLNRYEALAILFSAMSVFDL